MIFNKTPIEGAFFIELEKFGDERGSFARAWCKDEFAEQGIRVEMVQGNIGYSRHKNTIRGMHWQLSPHGEGKLVRCTKGAAWDVVLDLRKDSESYKQWIGFELCDDKSEMVYLPPGCAHGYQTLRDHTELFYQVTEFYAPNFERGVRWNDPEFGIEWKFDKEPILSDKDKSWPDFNKTEKEI